MKNEELKKEHCCCNDECNCGENCECGDECKCHEEENENHECNCNNECNCGENCECGDECKCHQEEIEEFDESEEILILKNNLQHLEEKLKLSQAELINYRKRKDEEVTNRLKFANQDLIFDILPILDNFDRAIKLQKNDDTNLTKFLDGFKMIYNSLNETLKKYGVQEIECLNKEFDPNFHEAMLVEKDETKEDNIVLEVLIKGYMLKDRIIRPASVKVNKLN